MSKKIKKILKFSFILTLLFLIMNINVLGARGVFFVSHPFTAKILSSGDILPENCSIEITNLENNISINASCEYCECIADLGDIFAKKGNIISVDVCIYNKTECRTDKFIVDGNSIRKRYNVGSCYPDYYISFELTSLKKENYRKKSESQDLLYLKEDNILRLDRIDIIKTDNCTINKGWIIDFNIYKPDGEKNNPFGIDRIDIPPLEEDQIYSLDFNMKTSKKVGDHYHPISNYTELIDNDPTGKVKQIRGFQDLSIDGTWSITAWLSRIPPSEYFYEENVRFILNLKTEESTEESYFKVESKSDYIAAQETKNIKNLTFILVIFTVIMAIPALLKIDDYFKKNPSKLRKKSFLWIILIVLISSVLLILNLEKIVQILTFSYVIALVYILINRWLIPTLKKNQQENQTKKRQKKKDKQKIRKKSILKIMI